jgi:hypothetical protein
MRHSRSLFFSLDSRKLETGQGGVNGSGVDTVPVPKRLKSAVECTIACVRAWPSLRFACDPTQSDLPSVPPLLFHFDGHKNRKKMLLAGTVDGLFPSPI